MVFDSKSNILGGTERSTKSLTIRILRPMMDQIHSGHISVVLPSGDRIDHSGERAGPSATLFIHRWRTIRRLISQGDLGFAQSHIDGDWSSPDLATLLELAALNTATINSKIPGIWPLRALNLFSSRRRHTR